MDNRRPTDQNSKPSVIVRPATIHDRATANAIHKSAYPGDPYTYANNIGRHGVINLVAEKDGEVSGFVSALVNAPNPFGKYLWERMRPYIAFVGVAADHRGGGIGEVLVASVSRSALELTGRGRIYLECEAENEPARHLYEKLGFVIVSPEEVQVRFRRPPNQKSLVYSAKRSNFGLE